MNIDDIPEDSDTSDEDYDPGEKQEVVSEVDSDGDPEDPISDSEEVDDGKKNKGKKKAKQRKRKAVTANEIVPDDKKVPKQEDLEKKKKKDDDIWADFMKDTGFQSKNAKKSTELSTTSCTSKPNDRCESQKKTTEVASTTTQKPLHRPVEKVKITQVFEFAGEEVKVEKEVSADSAEARLLSGSSDKPDTTAAAARTSKGKRTGGLSGIGNVLSQLSKKPKISTLEKTKLDWESFKKEENIEEELQTFNKGKDGYLDRQDFLERADLRRFEIEKEIRSIERNKRFNSSL